jgi:hypothetical protein
MRAAWSKEELGAPVAVLIVSRVAAVEVHRGGTVGRVGERRRGLRERGVQGSARVARQQPYLVAVRDAREETRRGEGVHTATRPPREQDSVLRLATHTCWGAHPALTPRAPRAVRHAPRAPDERVGRRRTWLPSASAGCTAPRLSPSWSMSSCPSRPTGPVCGGDERPWARAREGEQGGQARRTACAEVYGAAAGA